MKKKLIDSSDFHLVIQNSNGVTLYKAPDLINRVHEKERHDIVQLADLLINPRMNIEDKAYIYEALEAIEPEQRMIAVQHALALTTEGMTGHEKALILGLIQQIPENVRANVVYHAKFFITAAMDPNDVEDILNAVLRFSPDEKKDIIPLVNSLITKVMLADDVLSIFNVVRDLDLNERERADFVGQATCLKHRLMNVDSILRILDAIQRLPSDQRAVVPYTSSLFTEETDVATTIRILNDLTVYPANERKSLTEQTLKLVPADSVFTEDAESDEEEEIDSLTDTRMRILKALADRPFDERDSLTRQIIKLIPKEMDISLRIFAIAELAGIDKDERENAVKDACVSENPTHRLALIRALKKD